MNYEQMMPSAFSLNVDVTSLNLDWAFERHHIIYASEGMVKIETDQSIWRLPPSRAVWMRAGTKGKVFSDKVVQGVSVFFADNIVINEEFQCKVFNLNALAREMIMHTLSWGPERNKDDSQADRFFTALADICQELMSKPDLLSLPKAKTAEVQKALDYTRTQIDQPISFSELAKVISMSERTLARRLGSEIHMTWSQYQSRARMIEAMDLLSRGRNVSQTALSVGFQNLGAFSTAFQKHLSLSPSQFQKTLFAK